MTIKIGINGFGRIGRLAFRRLWELRDTHDVQVVAINDLSDPAMLAYLLQYDSTHGRFPGTVTATATAIWVDGQEIPIYAQADARHLPWVAQDGVTIVLECTGFYTSARKAQAHLDAGAQRVLISAPAGDDVKTIVAGVNDQTLTANDHLVSAGSCTTNCLAPMAAALDAEFKLIAGTMTTVHAFTASQTILDGPHSRNRRANRTASTNIIPHSSGAAKAIGLVLPQLAGKLTGHAQRVPVVDGSLTELVSVVQTPHLTAEQVNQHLYPYTQTNPGFSWTPDEIVSSDILGNPAGSIFDATQTTVVTAGTTQLIKTVAWYDNEYGFTCQLIRTLLHLAQL